MLEHIKYLMGKGARFTIHYSVEGKYSVSVTILRADNDGIVFESEKGGPITCSPWTSIYRVTEER